ncbi:Hypothetical predicted protein [Cloeon dipterum]|nr:Hypothetical predicted protein [Cloeon dipterum]
MPISSWPPAPTLSAHVLQYGGDNDETKVDEFIRSVGRLRHLWPNYSEEQLVGTALAHLTGAAYDFISSLPGHREFSLESLKEALKREFEPAEDYEDRERIYYSIKKDEWESVHEFRQRVVAEARALIRLRPTYAGETATSRRSLQDRMTKSQFLRGLPERLYGKLIGREKEDFDELVKLADKFHKHMEKEKKNLQADVVTPAVRVGQEKAAYTMPPPAAGSTIHYAAQANIPGAVVHYPAQANIPSQHPASGLLSSQTNAAFAAPYASQAQPNWTPATQPGWQPHVQLQPHPYSANPALPSWQQYAQQPPQQCPAPANTAQPGWQQYAPRPPQQCSVPGQGQWAAEASPVMSTQNQATLNPRSKSATQGKGKGAFRCHRCYQEGHISRDCPKPCGYCNLGGHTMSRCPELPCPACQGKGHLPTRCPTAVPPQAPAPVSTPQKNAN